MEQIDLNTAKEMVARYGTTRKQLIDTTYSINDTKSSFIPIADLRAYVANLPSTATGVRIYLAAYDDTDTSYPSQTTVVIVGTVNNGTEDTDLIIGDNTDPLLGDGGLGPVNKTGNCPPSCP